VNVAARLEALARPGQTLVTASVATRVGTRFDLRSLGDHAVRGKSERVEILEVAS
jgi:class 3 adenylate cyclase